VKHRAFRPLVYVFVAVQLLLSVPVSPASAREALAEAATTQAMPCDDMQATEHHSKHCPCCPDGTEGALDCQTACAAGVAVLPAANFYPPSPVAVSAAEPPPVNFLPLANPPLKPPPIA
jgi:hypothetical protein